MSGKIDWIDNLRALACMMVVLIHTTTYYVTSGPAAGAWTWEMANLLNSASRVSVPLFFMISGYLFFGERSAEKKHFTRIGLCLLFYSALGLLYIAALTQIGAWASLKGILQRPVFYHLWFFYAIIVIYLLSPLISVKPASGRYLALVVLLLAIAANPNTSRLTVDGVRLLPVNLYVYGDTFYYLLYALMGRAIGMLDTRYRGVSWAAAGVFVACVILIALGTRQQLRLNGGFADTYYIYCGPLVFLAAVALLVWCKNCLSRPLSPLALLSRHSLAIYGFHAFIIHFMRTRSLEVSAWPMLDIVWIFCCALLLSLLLSMGLQRLDRRRLVC